MKSTALIFLAFVSLAFVSLAFVSLAFVSLASSASIEHPLEVKNIDGWKFALMPKDTFVEQFTGGAEAALTYGKTADGAPAATVLVYKMDNPTHAVLAGDASAWHKFIFSKPATVNISVVSEKVVQVNGAWRYYIEFQSDTGTMLNTAAMATVVNGQVHVLLFENSRSTFLDLIGKVRELYHGIELR